MEENKFGFYPTPYTTYLFDFDYTLVDSSEGIVMCYRTVLERHGHCGITDAVIKRTIGKTLEDSFTEMTGITDPDTLAAYKREYVREADEHMTAHTYFFDETLDVLRRLKARGARLGIISTKYRYRIHQMMDNYLPADFFDIVVGGEDVTRHKPDPEGLLAAMERLGCRREEVLYVGDSLVDAATAQRAGVDFAAVLHGTTTRREMEDFPHRMILDDLTGIG